MKKCANCGKLFDKEVKFCTECGNTVFTEVDPEFAGAARTGTDTSFYGHFPAPAGKQPARKTVNRAGTGTFLGLMILYGFVPLIGPIVAIVLALKSDVDPGVKSFSRAQLLLWLFGTITAVLGLYIASVMLEVSFETMFGEIYNVFYNFFRLFLY